MPMRDRGTRAQSLQFELRPVPPFRLDLTVWALRREPKNRLDRWDGITYQRAIAQDGLFYDLSVRQKENPDEPVLDVEVHSIELRPGLKDAAARILSLMLGIDIDLSGFYRFAAGHAQLESLVERFKGVKPPRFPGYFEALCNGILFQQVSLPAGFTLLNNLVEVYGPVPPSAAGHAFPLPESIAPLTPEVLRPLGVSHQKGRALVELAARIISEPDLGHIETMSDDDAKARLYGLRGVGRWTAQYFLLRGLGRLYVFPGDDVGARNKLKNWLGLEQVPDYAAMQKISAGWYPYAGMIYFHFLLNHLAEKGYIR